MNSRHRAIAVAVVISSVLLLGACSFWWFSADSHAHKEVGDLQRRASGTRPDSERGAGESVPVHSETDPDAPAIFGDPGALVPLELSDQELFAIGGGVEVIAYSREEANWLDRNGFPRLEQLAGLDATPIEVLEARAASGGAVDIALLAHKRVRMGACATKVQAMDCAEGYRQAAVHGSLWALSKYVSTAKYYADELDIESRRWIDAHALVAERLGMFDELTEQQNQQLRKLRGEDAGAADLADEVLTAINSERAALGLSAWSRDPRPAEARQRAMNDYLVRSMDSNGRPRPNVRRYHYPRE